MRFSLVNMFFGLMLLSRPLHGQDAHGRTGYGLSLSVAPDSSHILIGHAEQRRVWTAGFEFDKTILDKPYVRLDYEGSISPFFQERDPTIAGSFATAPSGFVYSFPSPPVRVVTVNSAPIGYFSTGSSSPIPLYPIARSSENSYAVAFAPVGIRLNALNSSRLEPTFSTDLGLVVSSKDLPVDGSAQVNYTFSFGPGFEYFVSGKSSFRLEYIYRHMSNAGTGLNNPGIDAGVIRLTLSRRR